MMHENSYKIL